MGTRPITEFLPDGPPLTVDPLLAAIAAQALTADQTRTVSPDVIDDIKASLTMRLSASTSIGGEQASVLQIGRELEAVAARCTSTAWVLWNHLAVFHLFVGTLGPPHAPLLKEIVTNNDWVCFPVSNAWSLEVEDVEKLVAVHRLQILDWVNRPRRIRNTRSDEGSTAGWVTLSDMPRDDRSPVVTDDDGIIGIDVVEQGDYIVCEDVATVGRNF